MSDTKNSEIKFEGEEAGAGHAAPSLDLIAAAFLVGLSCLVMVASLGLPVPGDVTTAPGLLPFLTSASLFVMAMILGLSAWNRRKDGFVPDPADARNPTQDRHTLLLAVAIALYILALQVLAFQAFLSLWTIPFTLSAFEPVTIILLATVIHFAWRGPLWITVLISVAWTVTLSLVFQKLFKIPLPGGF